MRNISARIVPNGTGFVVEANVESGRFPSKSKTLWLTLDEAVELRDKLDSAIAESHHETPEAK